MLSVKREDNGLIHLECKQSTSETAERLETTLKKQGLQVFARVDHSRAAADAGLKMRPTQVLLFGNPTIGTPMMIAAPTLAIGLPSKALIWEDEAGRVWLTLNAPDCLMKRHGIPEALAGSLNTMVDLLHEVVKPHRPEIEPKQPS